MTDLRQHPRYAIELDAEISWGASRLNGRTHDISLGGFCFLAERLIEIGTECAVKLALVFSETEFSEQLSLGATVVWCTPFRGGHQIGLKFGHVDKQARAYLDLFLKFLQAGDADDADQQEEDE